MSNLFYNMPSGWLGKYMIADDLLSIEELRCAVLMPTVHKDKSIKLAIDNMTVMLIEIFVDPIYLFWSISVGKLKINVTENYEIYGSYYNAVLNIMNPLPELFGKLLGNKRKSAHLRVGLKYIFQDLTAVNIMTGEPEMLIENIKLFDNLVRFFKNYIRNKVAHSGIRDRRFRLCIGAMPHVIFTDGIDSLGKPVYAIDIMGLAFLYLRTILKYILELKVTKNGKIVEDFLDWYNNNEY